VESKIQYYTYAGLSKKKLKNRKIEKYEDKKEKMFKNYIN
jgi:hypothetical protein